MKNWIHLLLTGALAGCGSDVTQQMNGPKDMAINFNQFDFATQGTDDGGEMQTNDCTQFDPSGGQNCQNKGFGPNNGFPFPLATDKPPDPNESDSGIVRDGNGWLGLSQTMAAFDYLWPANSENWQRGTLSKFDAKTIREIARYYTTTCNSLGKGDHSAACDGKGAGCCAKDSYPQWQWRKGGKMGPDPGYQQVHLMSNNPSRTAVDFNGDVFVANRAFGGQSSVTKIANDVANCIDRNGNGKIDTSKDTNGDGVIDTDCNGDGQPDDIASVKAKACSNGMAQEFYGLDDECVLFTTNTGPNNQWGRPLSLGPGANDFGPSDAWAGTYNDGHFYRVDGTTGLTKDEADLQQAGNCQPYGLVVDSSGYGWSPNLSAPPLCFFNTKNTMQVATARNPTVGQLTGYGVGLDRDQQIWVACLGFGLCRYTPDRSGGQMAWQKLAQGGWTMVQSPGRNSGANFYTGVAADSRTANTYFVFGAGGNTVAEVPADPKALPPAKPMMDTLVDGSNDPAVQVAGEAKGVGVDRQQNVWNVSQGQAVVTRILVDMAGKMTAPVLNAQPMGNNKCPAGDTCPYEGPGGPSPYTYSDFTGFGLRNFTRPKGSYSYIQKGCDDMLGMPNSRDTNWLGVTFDADVPLNTQLTVHARSSTDGVTWGNWTPDYAVTPADLWTGMPLMPNGPQANAGYLQVEFQFVSMSKNASPKLKSFNIVYECPGIVG